MRNKSFYPRIAILVCAIAVPSCVTYTPITTQPITTQPITTPQTKQTNQQPAKPIPVPPPIPDSVHISIEPDEEPIADEGGLQLITEYANAQRNIKMHNQKLNTNR